MSDASGSGVADAGGASDAGPGSGIDVNCGAILTTPTAPGADAGAAPCTYLTAPPSSSTYPGAIDVYVGGNLIPHDPNRMNGWDFLTTDYTSFEIFGPVCDAITAGTAGGVSVTYLCLIR
jgi:hypothetical protein